MPELPEVETIRRQIAPVVEGQRIVQARVRRARAVRAHRSPAEFVALVTGRTVARVGRRGKVLLLGLDGERALLVRLGMSGRVVIDDPEAPFAPHTHVVLSLSNGMEMRFIDPRTFGEMAVVEGHDPDRMKGLVHYGPEPLGDAFTMEALRRAMAGKSAMVGAVLMDQTKVAGIGKIYADEACFLAGIHPQRPAGSLTADEVGRLHAAIRDVLAGAVAARGTSAQDGAYRDASGRPGEFQHRLCVYQRADQPCRVCGALVEYRPFHGRRTYFCPRCQR